MYPSPLHCKQGCFAVVFVSGQYVQPVPLQVLQIHV
jgi:hypothetical protein